MKLFILSSLFIAFAFTAYGQDTKESITAYLTNNNSRSWQYKNGLYIDKPSCSGEGQLFIFKINGTVTWIKCENGKLQTRELAWVILPTSDNDEWRLALSTSINVDGDKMFRITRIDFINPNINIAGIYMDWRIVPNDKSNYEGYIELTSKN